MSGELTGRTAAGIRKLAKDKGLNPDTNMPDKWMDPINPDRQRLLLHEEGHKDKFGQPFRLKEAAKPHVHGFESDGKTSVRDTNGSRHFPLKPTPPAIPVAPTPPPCGTETTHATNSLMNENKTNMVEFSEGEVCLWVEQKTAVMIKAVTKEGDPVELFSIEVRELGEALIRMADQIK